MATNAVERAAGFVIFKQESSKVFYLLLRASDGIHHWTPPKGHVEPGETDHEAAVRETREECGLSPNDYQVMQGFRKELNYTARGKPKVVVYMLAKLRNYQAKVVLSHEHDDYRWCPLKEACELSRFAEAAKLLNESERFISKAS